MASGLSTAHDERPMKVSKHTAAFPDLLLLPKYLGVIRSVKWNIIRVF